MHRQALRLSETVLGKEHPSILTSMSNLAGLVSCQGKYEHAEDAEGWMNVTPPPLLASCMAGTMTWWPGRSTSPPELLP